MLPPKELNPSDPERHGMRTMREDSADLHDRITELENRNLYLQSLVVELLDKNEQLRRKTAALETGNQ